MVQKERHGAAKQPWQQQAVYSMPRLGRIQGAFCDINVLFKYILELPIPQDLRSEDPTVGGWICYPIPARSDKGKGSNCPQEENKELGVSPLSPTTATLHLN
jgi:hypothetical protein